MKHYRSVTCILTIVITALVAASVHADDFFLAARQQYAAGNFAKAAETYEELVESGHGNAAAFYNLGNSYFQLHDFGRAILNYERALTLEPNHPEARTNLSVAEEEAHALELPPDWRDSVLHFARPNQYAVAGAAVFWIGAFLLAALVGAGRRRRLVLLGGLFCMSLCFLLAFVVYSLETGPRGGSMAIVAKGPTEARLATADTAANVLTLPAGSEIKIEERRGDWAYALLPNGMHGWVPLRQIDFVRL
jgi:tetratricopeptide (TPR) repeat protein